MCNAWNHPADCNCGFGGPGHLGRRGANHWCHSSPSPGVRVWTASSFCRPTRCPKCGAEVFFVLHNGGSVWFDSLGQPWPKHPCFDDEVCPDPQAVAAPDLREVLAAHAKAHPEGRFGIVERIELTGHLPHRNRIEAMMEEGGTQRKLTMVVTLRDGRKRQRTIRLPDGTPSPGRGIYRLTIRCSDGAVISTASRFASGLEIDGGVGTVVLIKPTEDGGLIIEGSGDVLWSIPVAETVGGEG